MAVLYTVATVLVEGMRTMFVNVPRSSAVDAYIVLIGVVVYVAVVVGIMTSDVVVKQAAASAFGRGLLVPTCTKVDTKIRESSMVISAFQAIDQLG